MGAVASTSIALVQPRPGVAQEAIPTGATEASYWFAKDGEKIMVRIGADTQEVRFIGVDAPEPAPGNDETECYFRESTDLLNSLLTDQVIYLESDTEDKDGNDRLWRYAWAYVNGVPTMLNEYVLAQGAAITQEEDKNTRYHDRLAQAQESAKSAGLGLWGTCQGNGHLTIPRYGGKLQPGMFGETLIAEDLAVTLSESFVTWDYNYLTPKGG
jgi:endonuclease YncB( thermonuclease family)